MVLAWDASVQANPQTVSEVSAMPVKAGQGSAVRRWVCILFFIQNARVHARLQGILVGRGNERMNAANAILITCECSDEIYLEMIDWNQDVV